MARFSRSARPVPLPDDAAIRLQRTIAARLSATLDDPELVGQVGSLCVPWLLADRARLRLDKAKRLRLAPEVNKAVKRLGRGLALMAVTGQSHGQQAAAAASKTLRAVRTRRVDMDGLLNLAAVYRSHRLAYRKRHGSPKVHAPEEHLLLDDGAMVATRVVSEQLLARLGQKAGNCLAAPAYRKGYAARLREGSTAFWRIDPVDEPDAPVWVVAISLHTGFVQELEHVHGFANMPRDRDALLEFFNHRAHVGPAWEDALAPFALSPELVAAARAGAVRCLMAAFAGTCWRFDVGTPGVLIAIPDAEPSLLFGTPVLSWMLHGAQTDARATLSIQHLPSPDARSEIDENDDDDGDTPTRMAAGPRTMLDMSVRFSLREACRASPALRNACREAFAAESPLFIEDWFGIAPRVTRPGPKQRE